MASRPPQNHSKPTSSNPWDVPPQMMRGDTSPDELLQSVGLALSSWEALEMHLGHLFSVLCDSNTVAAERAYGAVVGHSTRRDMLMAAAEVFCLVHDQDLKKITKFLDEVGRLASRRNEIAHGLISQHYGSEASGYYLGPPIYNTNKTALRDYKQKYLYTSDQIKLLSNHFRDYRVKLFHITDGLCAARSASQQKRKEQSAAHAASASHLGSHPLEFERQPEASLPSPPTENET